MKVPAQMIFMFCAVAAGVASPAREVTVQPVADLSAAQGAAWDLSRLEPVGSEIDLLIAEGDSLTSVWLPDTRFDFVVSGDTAALACEETRVYRVAFFPASVESNASGEALSAAFTARGRMYQSEYISAVGASSVMTAERVTLIPFSGDTIAGARLDRSTRTMRWSLSPDSTLSVSSLPDSMVMTTRIDRLRLTAPGELFPRAMKKVVTTSWLGQVVSADSSAWVLTTPVAAPSRTRRHYTQDTLQPDGGDLPPYPGGLPSITVTTSPDGITVIPRADSAPATAGQLRVAINDITGRSYIDTYVSGAGQSEIDTSSLPRGEYLIQVLSDGSPVAAIKYIKQ